MLVTVLSESSSRFAHGPSVSLKAQWPDLQWACGPKPTTEPAVLCASVPQRSQRILWEVISNSVFDRVVGRAQASKRTLERLENELPGAQNEAKMAPWRPPGGSLEAPWTPLGRPWGAEIDFRVILGAFWEAFWAPKRIKIGAKIEPEIQQRF